MDLAEDVRRNLLNALEAFNAEHRAELNERRRHVERQREESRQSLKACHIGRSAHEVNMMQAAQEESRVERDHQLQLDRLIDAHVPSPLSSEQRAEIRAWIEREGRRN